VNLIVRSTPLCRTFLFLTLWLSFAGTRAAEPDQVCTRCHPAESSGYGATPMAHSLRGSTGLPSGTFFHAASNTRFSIRSSRDGRMSQRITRNGITGEYEVRYVVGSGQHAVGFIIQLRDHLFQSPLCFYPGQGWGMAPGYEASTAPDFYRPITPECLSCHVGRANPKPCTENSYANPPILAEGITCERCHGPSTAHLLNPVPGSIINPGQLPPAARNSTCEQCHLSGEIRVPNPNQQVSDFRPGQKLEDVFSTYIFRRSLEPTAANPFKVISQAQQLALSTCARKSGDKLWCGTCHEPHKVPTDSATHFRNICLSCHASTLPRTHSTRHQDCIACHMPRRPVTDGGHSTFTDHRIRRTALADDLEYSMAAVPTDALVSWREPATAFADRNLGLAEVAVGQRLGIRALSLRGVRSLMASWRRFPRDAPILAGIGEVFFDLDRYDDSAAAYEQAIKVQPTVASNYLHAAVAWHAANNEAKSVQYLEKAIVLDPLIPDAYGELASVYTNEQRPNLALQTWKRLLNAFPNSIEARIAVERATHP
jgi:hypothetical protein